jgi:integrase
MTTRKSRGERRHGAGWEAYIRINGELRRKSFPLLSTPEQRHAWRVSQKHGARPRILRGSLADDVRAYLATVRHMPSYKDRAYHLAQWIVALGAERPRHSITTTDINTVLSGWAQRLSPVSVRHRRTALLHLWRTLDGPGANPVSASWRPADPAPSSRAVPLERIQQVLALLETRAPQTHARLLVMLTTGLPHKLLSLLTPADIDRARAVATIPARQKGKGAAARILPLSDAALHAFTKLHAADAWGAFSNSGMHSVLHRACDAVGVPRFRPYDVRHTYGTLIYQLTGDLATTARLLGNSPRMAERYASEANLLVDTAAQAKVGTELSRQLAITPKAKKKR